MSCCAEANDSCGRADRHSLGAAPGCCRECPGERGDPPKAGDRRGAAKALRVKESS